MFKRNITFHSDEFSFIADDVDEIIAIETEEKNYKKIKVEISFYEDEKNEN